MKGYGDVWISVYDSLPDPDTLVWVYWKDKEVRIAYHIDMAHAPPNQGWHSIDSRKIRWTSYWMPMTIPSPPDSKNNWMLCENDLD